MSDKIDLFREIQIFWDAPLCAGQRLLSINHIQSKSFVYIIYVCVLCIFIMYI